jgi:2,3-dihydroxy-p-cumate/2,3-dihydroxybenzoate 3,4-dioxygenase
MRLRSVELQVTEVTEAAEFLERIWGLVPVKVSRGTRYFRGAGDHPYLLSITPADAPAVLAITFSGSPAEVDQVRDRANRAGVPSKDIAASEAPGGGAGISVQGPEAQTYRFLVEQEVPARLVDRDKPIQITHAVINAIDVAVSERFAVEVLGFRVSDRTRAMTFVRCNRKHHSIAFAHSDVSSLNHIAFEMENIDAVMRGFGRMRDAGYDPVWGPGRHGPGNNVFGYFIAPFGAVIEYTAEIAEVDDGYKVGGPEDWKWPPGRIDHWGASGKNVARISEAERAFRFPASLN